MKVSYAALDLQTGRAYAVATPSGITRLELRPGLLAGFIGVLKDEYGVIPVEDERPFHTLKRELDSYFSGEPVVFTSRLDLVGTEFQKKVWRALMKVPYGNVRSYKWLAGLAGNPDAARAVGGALNRNRIPIIIPCHRVVQSTGGIGGFACGLDVKRMLLGVEGVIPPYRLQ